MFLLSFLILVIHVFFLSLARDLTNFVDLSKDLTLREPVLGFIDFFPLTEFLFSVLLISALILTSFFYCFWVFFFLTFISIYSMLNLLPGHKVLFLQFLLKYLFLLCILLFCFRNILVFFSKNHLRVAGTVHVWVNLPMNSFKSASHLGSFTWMHLVSRESTSQHLS